MNLTSPLNFIAQKLLYLWIKTDIIQAGGSMVKNDRAIIIYVLASRAWSDLLVLEKECKTLHITTPLSRINQPQLKQWHHVYTVAQSQPLKAWLQQKTKHSSMLSGICQALEENPELDVYFVPVVIFWGRPVLGFILRNLGLRRTHATLFYHFVQRQKYPAAFLANHLSARADR